MKKYIAEAVGTFLLALAVNLSLAGKFPVPTPVIAALTVGVCVYTMGAISGTHINPCITLGLLAVRKISPKDAAGYLVAQFAGAMAAMLAARAMAAPAAVTAGDSGLIFACEALGAFVLAYGVASVAFAKASADVSGLVIGGSLLVGISIAAIGSNGVVNPAVAVGIGSVSLSYELAPLVGGTAAMLLYQFVER